jgi:hypothetical protein
VGVSRAKHIAESKGVRRDFVKNREHDYSFSLFPENFWFNGAQLQKLNMAS